jgi:hypothetical protein
MLCSGLHRKHQDHWKIPVGQVREELLTQRGLHSLIYADSQVDEAIPVLHLLGVVLVPAMHYSMHDQQHTTFERTQTLQECALCVRLESRAIASAPAHLSSRRVAGVWIMWNCGVLSFSCTKPIVYTWSSSYPTNDEMDASMGMFALLRRSFIPEGTTDLALSASRLEASDLQTPKTEALARGPLHTPTELRVELHGLLLIEDPHGHLHNHSGERADPSLLSP